MSVVYANCTTTTARNGMPFRIEKGDVWDADDPLVKAHPELFDEEPAKVRRSQPEVRVEQATAAPGERRNVQKPKK